MQFHTIKKRERFVTLARKGHKVVTKGIVLQAMHNDSDTAPANFRVGFVASKKLGKAVTRNYVKRKLRSLVQHVFPKLAKTSCDYVLIGKKHAIDRNYLSLKKDLIYAMHTIHDEISMKQSIQEKSV